MGGVVRHTSKTVAIARSLSEGGWTPHEIQQQLVKGGTSVSFATVKAWVDEDYRLRRNHITAEDQRRWRDVSGAHVKRRIVELHGFGLSVRAIGVVTGVYHGRPLTEHQVRRVIDSHRSL